RKPEPLRRHRPHPARRDGAAVDGGLRAQLAGPASGAHMTAVELLAWVRASSRDAQAPARLPWPERLTAQEWCFRPQWLSLQGTAAFDALDDEGRRLLAFHEAVNFFSLNLHGEGPLIAEL